MKENIIRSASYQITRNPSFNPISINIKSRDKQSVNRSHRNNWTIQQHYKFESVYFGMKGQGRGKFCHFHVIRGY